MKDNLISEVFGLNSKEKKLFFKKTNFNYSFSSFSDFQKTYEDIAENLKTFFKGYSNKNNINKIPKPFEMIFFGYIQEKHISDKHFLVLKDRMNDFSFKSEYQIYTLFEVINVINEINSDKKRMDIDYKNLFYLQYPEQKLLISLITDILKKKKANINDIILDLTKLESFLKDIKKELEKDKNIKIVYTEEEYLKWLYDYYKKLTKEIDKYFQKK